MRRIRTSRACPLCGGRFGRRVWREGEYHFVLCSTCGLVFSDLTEEEYGRVRHNVWNDDALGPETLAFYGDARALAHASFLAHHPPVGGGRLLDVGCGLGFFLERARACGWNVTGLDSSPSWVRRAGERLGSGCVHLGTLADTGLDGARFDLITAWDVIEHIFDPVSLLEGMRARLAPGGSIFLRTPNIAYGYPIYLGRRHLLGHDVELGPTNHVVYFTSRTLRLALTRAGLRPVDWRAHPPPQVGLTRAKALYLSVANATARASAARVVLSSDLDVLAITG